MITLERMLILKSVTLFKLTPDEILLAVAHQMKEQRANKGELVLKQGELGDMMYIIVTGKISVHDGDRLIAEMGEREVFGELAALSPSKRIASVTALEDSFFLTLSHSLIYELMDLHVGLSKGIIQVLCQRVRSISEQVSKTRSTP